MSKVIRTSEKTVAEVQARFRKISVTVNESLSIAESKELRAKLKAAESVAREQSHQVDIFGGLRIKSSIFGGL